MKYLILPTLLKMFMISDLLTQTKSTLSKKTINHWILDPSINPAFDQLITIHLKSQLTRLF